MMNTNSTTATGTTRRPTTVTPITRTPAGAGPAPREARQYVTAIEVFDAERFAADFKAYAHRHGASMRHVSRVTGIWHAAIGELVNGTRCPNLHTVIVLAKYADLSIDSYIR